MDIAATTPISELAPTLQLLRKAWPRQQPYYRQRRDDLQRLRDILALRMIIWDRSVVAMDGQRLRPRASGSTMVEVRAGDQSGGAIAKVYEPLSTLDGLRPDQEHVAVPLRLAGGEMRRWRIPAGGYMFWMLPYEYEGRRATGVAGGGLLRAG